MKEKQTNVFSAKKVNMLEVKIRRLLQNLHKILKPFIFKDLTLVD